MSRPFMARATCVVLALGAFASHASAQITPGSRLELSGLVDATDIGAAGIVLDFQPGTLTSGAGSTGSFASIPATGGAIRGMTVGVGPIALPSFVTFGGYRFDVTFIPTGSFGQGQCYVEPAVGQTCTPIQSPNPFPSPFDLTNYDSGNPEAPFRSVASFQVQGFVTGPGNVTSPFVGVIAAEFPTMSFQEALMTVETTGIRDIRYTATFTTTVGTVTTTPEPSTWALLATGLAGVVVLARRRDRIASRARTPRA